MSKGGVVAVALALAAGFALGRFGCANNHKTVTQATSAVAATNAVACATTTAATNAAASATTTEATSAVAEATITASTATNNTPRPLTFHNADYNDDDCVKITMSAEPDMDSVRQYVSIEPQCEGAPSFRLATSYGIPALCVSGNFAFRTNVTIRVRAGLPSADDKISPLENDFSFSFKRHDKSPRVSFAHSGRYLPPDGNRELLINSVNVSNIETTIRAVLPRNVIMFLALEEDAFNLIRTSWWSDGDEYAGDLSTLVSEKKLPVDMEPNKTQYTPLSLGDKNGTYLVSISSEDASTQYRVVCVSDIGISAREAQGKLTVWTTSLTSGAPLGGVNLAAYSTAGELVAQGVTAANGLAVLEKCAEATPFAIVASITAQDGSVADSTFMALRDSMEVDEAKASYNGDEVPYLKRGETEAFVWTDRGIYRHDEKIMLHTLLRGFDGKACEPFPLVARLVKPSGKVYATTNLMPDTLGAAAFSEFSVAADQPSGAWRLEIMTPGKQGKLLGSRKIAIEEFAPPTIRVKVEAATGVENAESPRDFAFRLSAEHLYGGPARNLRCEGAVIYKDYPFAPAGWDGWYFGNDNLGLKPSFRRLSKDRLDYSGAHIFSAPLQESSGLPKAALHVTVEGTAFEDGGRPATARDTAILHYYPFYIGSTIGSWVKRPETGPLAIPIACVLPSGQRLAEPKRLTAKLERIDSIYAYRRGAQGWATWDCEKIRTVVADNLNIDVPAEGEATLELPAYESGDWCVTVTDPASGESFGKSFYLSSWGDDEIRAPLSNPTQVAISADKDFYRTGESPRLIVKSPFTGSALVSILREDVLFTDVVTLTNATSEIILPPIERGMAPSVDVTISVVQGETENSGRLAVRSHGEITLSVRPTEREIDVKLDAVVDFNADSGATVNVDISAPGAEKVAITLVDEAINILTDEKCPDPIGYFSRKRTATHPLYDLYHRLLPVVTDEMRRSGVKIGGGLDIGQLSRVSPVPTRRFVPLAMWKLDIPVKDGKAEAFFELPEFVGEIRVTAVAYSASAEGSAAVHRKVAPKVVMQPDAPRFAAPGDTFDITLSIANNSPDAAEIDYEISAEGPLALQSAAGAVHLEKDGSKLLTFSVTATGVGEAKIVYVTTGCGERHTKEILLPVRPGVPWIQKSGVELLAPGETKTFAFAERQNFSVSATPAAKLAPAFDWLAKYPHGCLEQTCSRAFPLVASKNPAHQPFLLAAVRRVESMMREKGFVMWPDCNYPPWDEEVSLYAAHFLVASKMSSQLDLACKYLAKWAVSTNTETSAYACYTLALAGKPDKDRMLRLYDLQDNLSTLARARLAGAFIAIADVARAKVLLEYFNEAPAQSAKEIAFAIPALMDLNPDDPLVNSYIAKLETLRSGSDDGAWYTTEENAHALLAMGTYFQRKGIALADTKEPPNVERNVAPNGSTTFTNCGTNHAYIVWNRLELPDIRKYEGKTSSVFSLTREFRTAEGGPVDLANVERGDLINVVLTLKSAEDRSYSDLVIEDLLSAGFEPVLGSSDSAALPDWLIRTDMRDDRFLAFSKRFRLKAGEEATVSYQIRAVTAGAFLLPGSSVEAMYFPNLASRANPAHVAIVDSF